MSDDGTRESVIEPAYTSSCVPANDELQQAMHAMEARCIGVEYKAGIATRMWLTGRSACPDFQRPTMRVRALWRVASRSTES